MSHSNDVRTIERPAPNVEGLARAFLALAVELRRQERRQQKTRSGSEPIKKCETFINEDMESIKESTTNSETSS